MIGRCDQCRFWRKEEAAVSKECMLFSGSADWSAPNTKAFVVPEAGANEATFMTAPDFGCAQFEAHAEMSTRQIFEIKNRRRIDLIKKECKGALSANERDELEILQRETEALLDTLYPLTVQPAVAADKPKQVDGWLHIVGSHESHWFNLRGGWFLTTRGTDGRHDWWPDYREAMLTLSNGVNHPLDKAQWLEVQKSLGFVGQEDERHKI